jgi:pimeloyl-ACP methyl ester carboxylesterase
MTASAARRVASATHSRRSAAAILPPDDARPLPESSRRGPARDAGRGPAILFLHGLASNFTHWIHVAPHFADRFRVLGIDLPGHGETGAPHGPLSVRALAGHVRRFLDRIGIDRALLVGHSLGGMVAAQTTLDFPDRVDRLVLVNPAGFQILPRPLRLAGHLFLRRRLLDALLPPLWKSVLDNVFFQRNEYTRGFIRSVDESATADDIQAFSAAIAGLRADFLDRDFLDVLHRIDRPTLLLWGQEDRLTPAAPLRGAARRLPHVAACEIPACGHMPIIECPEIVRAVIDRFLES